MTTLAERLAEKHELDALIEQQDGELTPEMEALWDASNEAVKDKVESWGLWITRQQNQADAIDAEIARLRKRRDVIDAACARSKTELQRQMEAAGLDKVKGVLVTVAVQENNPSVAGELDRVALWKLYEAWRTEDAPPFAKHIDEYTLDKKAVLEAAKAGQPIPEGLTVVRNRSLRIR